MFFSPFNELFFGGKGVFTILFRSFFVIEFINNIHIMLLFLFRTTFTITNSKCIMCVVAQDCLTIVVTIERTKWLQVITEIF